MYISIISQIVIPLGICFGVQTFSTLDPSDIWLAIVVGHATRMSLSVIVFRRGKWRDIKVDLGETSPA